jgi:hypothetical protein
VRIAVVFLLAAGAIWLTRTIVGRAEAARRAAAPGRA